VRLDPAVAACRVAVRRELRDLPAGALVVAACSGGADSLVLAAALLWEAPRGGLRVGVASVDHGLQEGSAQRAAGVAAWADVAGAERTAVLPVEVGSAGGPEAAARDARYAALRAVAARWDAAAVLLGHTLDDQAETVLLGLARGSGAGSLSGMPPRRDLYRRPFLSLDRATTLAACAALGLSPWADPHNADPAYARARVRATALPALEAALGPGIAAALARSAAQLRDDADALEEWAALAQAAATSAAGLDVAVVGGLPPAVRRRLLRRAALAAGVPAGRLTAVHLAGMDALVTDWHGQRAVALPSAYGCERRCGFLRFCGGAGVP